jgi:exonuclease III
MRIVFWNVNRSDLGDLVCSIANSTKADVMVLIENSTSSQDTLQKFHNQVSTDYFISPTVSERRFQCFSINRALDLQEVHSGTRISVRKLNISKEPILLAFVHGPDIRNNDIENRNAYALTLASELEFAKMRHQTNRIIVLGDFNMNPFDRGMNHYTGFNAMMTKACALNGTRRNDDKDYDLYYNPMWSCLGDLSSGPPGTIYDTSSVGQYGWSMLDQVIISHSVLNHFSEVQIITTAGLQSLLTKRGIPDKKRASNHLPVMLELQVGQHE